MHDRTAGGLRAVRPTPDTLAGVIAYALEHRLRVTFGRPPSEKPAFAQVTVETFANLPEVPGEPQLMAHTVVMDWSDVIEHRGDVMRILLVRAIFELEDDIAGRDGMVTS